LVLTTEQEAFFSHQMVAPTAVFNVTKEQIHIKTKSQQLIYVYQEMFQLSGNVIEIKKKSIKD
jgi:hypothetical protein